MKLEKLKPCPFCGQTMRLTYDWHEGRTRKAYIIIGHKTNCFLWNTKGVFYWYSEEEAIEAWNGRCIC